jgi:hypothetical protein
MKKNDPQRAHAHSHGGMDINKGRKTNEFSNDSNNSSVLIIIIIIFISIFKY